MKTPTAVYGLDVGNTRAKFFSIQDRSAPSAGAVFSSPDWAPEPIRTYSRQEPDLAATIVEHLESDSRLHVVSVDPDFDRALEDAVRRRAPDPVDLRAWTTDRIPMAHPYEDSTRLGADRLLAAWAAQRLAGAPLVVIDAGTAMTLDLVTRDGSFAGGAIAPGLGLSARALGQGGARLCIREPLWPLQYPGSNTEAALDAGLLAGFVGGAEKLIAVARKIEPRATLVITGGEGPMLCAALADEEPRFVPDLLERGLSWLEARLRD